MKKIILPLIIAGTMIAKSSDAQKTDTLYSSFDANTIQLIKSKYEGDIREIFDEIASDTTYNNKFYNDSLSAEIALWEMIFSLDSTQSVVYNKKTFEITDIMQSQFAFTYSAQRKLDIKIIDSIHVAKTGRHAPRRRSDKIYSFRYGRRGMIEKSLEKMLPFLEIYSKRLKDEHVAISNLIIPVYESGFEPYVRSYAGAVGMFQFMKGTADDFGLDRSLDVTGRFHNFDLRRSYIDSFEAYLKYLSKAHKRFSDNPAFIPTSFNIGLYSKKLRVNNKAEEIDALRKMGFAPRSYLVELIAIAKMLQNFDENFPNFDFSYDKIKFVKVNKSINISEVKQMYAIPTSKFYKLNPQYIPGVNFTVKKGRQIVVPAYNSISRELLIPMLQKE